MQATPSYDLCSRQWTLRHTIRIEKTRKTNLIFIPAVNVFTQNHLVGRQELEINIQGQISSRLWGVLFVANCLCFDGSRNISRYNLHNQWQTSFCKKKKKEGRHPKLAILGWMTLFFLELKWEWKNVKSLKIGKW